jgi:hypothetical protein
MRPAASITTRPIFRSTLLLSRSCFWTVPGGPVLTDACPVLRDAFGLPGSSGGVGLPALLLAGYAIEDYAKASLVEDGKTSAYWERGRRPGTRQRAAPQQR